MDGIVQLLVQLVSGAAGGNATGKAAPKISLGNIGNTIAGLLGGVGLGQLLPLLGIGGGEAGSIGNILTTIVGGGVGGGVLTAIVGFIKNMLAKK